MSQIQQSLQLALQQHQAGRLAEAEGLYRQILSQQPNNPDALHLLGLLAQQVGRNDIAVELIGRAVQCRGNFPEAYCNLGSALKALGQLESAANAYRQAIASRPAFPEAHCNLGAVLTDLGQFDEAIVACQTAISQRPNFADAHNNLGQALQRCGRFAQAVVAYRQAIALNPRYAIAYNSLGHALRATGQLDEAIAAYRQAIALNANFAAAYGSLGNALVDKKQLEEAVAACRRAIELQPGLVEAYCNLGRALNEQGQTQQALEICRQAVEMKPDHGEAHYNLATALRCCGQFPEAEAAYRQAIAVKPTLFEAYGGLSSMLCEQGQLDAACTEARNAVQALPNNAKTYWNLATILQGQGELDQAIDAYRSALRVDPTLHEVHSNLIVCLHYHPLTSATTIAREHQRYDSQHARPLGKEMPPARREADDRDPNRKLRVGYVSPDFREHVIGRFLLPLLANHNRERCEIFAYADLANSDEMTQRLRGHTDTWRDLQGVSDAQAAALIRQDRIDILVDLTMHMAGNRLLVFARKPAPVQVTYLAYAGGSGLSAMDYRLSDSCLDAPGADSSLYAQRTIQLPSNYWCYQAVLDLSVGVAPVTQKGVITFGCLNNFCKINDPLVELWARIMQTADRSRLLLHAPEASARHRVLEKLRSCGVESHRVWFVPTLPRAAYFAQYQAIDIALDTFPFAGATTTCDALWMGVPVVSLQGNLPVSRSGRSILANVGLSDLVAETGDAYVQVAAALAQDVGRLSSLRSTLRQRMLASPLMDAPRFAADVETAYRTMWQNWCTGAAAKG